MAKKKITAKKHKGKVAKTTAEPVVKPTAETLKKADTKADAVAPKLAPKKKHILKIGKTSTSKTPYSRYSSFRLQPRIKSDKPKILGSFRLLRQTLGILGRNWKPFLGIVVIYGIFNVILVQSFATLDLDSTKTTLENVFSGHWNQLLGGLSLFAYLVGSSTTTASQTAGAYQLTLIILSSLAAIWALRQVYIGHTVRIRDAYYKGMYPLVPFILVLAAIVFQLIPILLGSYLYGFAGQGGSIGGVELALWVAALFALTVLSLYMLCSSLFALYIACLPDVAPLQALRSARKLVRFRRWTVMRRILFLPFSIVVIGGIIMVPVIIFAERAAVWVFFVLTMFVIPIVHAYMYGLYRELLKDE